MEEELVGLESSFEESEPDEKTSDPLKNGLGTDDLTFQDQKISLDDKSEVVNDLVLAVMRKIKDPLNLKNKAVGGAEEKSKNGQKKNDELCLLKKRMLQMKSRLLLKLQLPEKAEAVKKLSTQAKRLKRQSLQEKETPEQATERRRRQAEQVRVAQTLRYELETPEQRSVRIEKQNTKRMMTRQQKQAKQTPEERVKRLEHFRKNNRKYKIRKFDFLSTRTGKIRNNIVDNHTKEAI